MSIPTSLKITVYADMDYRYEVECDDSFSISYVETVKDTEERQTNIGFGSIDEMEATANAMLKIVKMARELNIV